MIENNKSCADCEFSELSGWEQDTKTGKATPVYWCEKHKKDCDEIQDCQLFADWKSVYDQEPITLEDLLKEEQQCFVKGKQDEGLTIEGADISPSEIKKIFTESTDESKEMFERMFPIGTILALNIHIKPKMGVWKYIGSNEYGDLFQRIG